MSKELTLDAISHSIKKIAQAFVDFGDSVAELIRSISGKLFPYWEHYLKAMYPDKYSLIHKAFHHKKYRVRKKCLNRLFRELRRTENGNTQMQDAGED